MYDTIAILRIRNHDIGVYSGPCSTCTKEPEDKLKDQSVMALWSAQKAEPDSLA